jgi:hypothetical protein
MLCCILAKLLLHLLIISPHLKWGNLMLGFQRGAKNPFGQGSGQSHHREVEHCASEAPCSASLLTKKFLILISHQKCNKYSSLLKSKLASNQFNKKYLLKKIHLNFLILFFIHKGHPLPLVLLFTVASHS